MTEIERTLLRFHRRLTVDPHHRYRSWGHCYKFFRRRQRLRARRDLDLCALQLGFYLASWGMYRGSSFLLWKDYKIHQYAIREVLRPEYDPLLDIDFESAEASASAVPRILDLATAIRNTYAAHVTTVDTKREEVKVTNTLVTKIILGVLACTPAYDTYVIEGIRDAGIPFSALNERHLDALFNFYRTHATAFKAIQGRINEAGMRYPTMKLLDMYFWERGRRLSE